MKRERIVIAGASGFVGRHLVRSLARDHDVIALSRLAPGSSPSASPSGVEWRSCDLLSLSRTEEALSGATVAFYLVHSMMPAATLSQGGFWDYDLIAADNFARAAAKAGVRRIVYLGGLVPSREALSRHLSSRYEVDLALRSHAVPVTTLRAGLIVGAEGSSFLTMLRLVERAPFLLAPPWADTITHPIALEDVLALLRFCLEHPETAGQSYDIGGPELMSYRNLVLALASCLGVRRRLIAFPPRDARLLQGALTALTGAPRELVGPLLDSLRYPIVARERKLNELAGLPGKSFSEAAREAIASLRESRRNGRPREEPVAFQRARGTGSRPTVRSVQRLPLPAGRSAEWLASEYFRWLPRGPRCFLKVDLHTHLPSGAAHDGETELITVSLRFPVHATLLTLERVSSSSSDDRQLFRITGGCLVRPAPRQRLEFRKALGGRCALAAVLDYRPRLPWPLYRITQALVHLWVMRSFKQHLERLSSGPAAPSERDFPCA